MAGTFTKNKKCKTAFIQTTDNLSSCLHNLYIDEPCPVSVIISGVNCDVAAWPGRERERETDGEQQRAYFGIVTTDRTIEFECSGKGEKQMWIEGIQYMMNFRAYVK